MALRWLEATTLALVFVIATPAATMSAAQQTVPMFPTLPSCPPAPLSLSPCLGYVFGVGSTTLDSCCSQLRSFVQAQAPCLCAASKLAPSPVGLLLGQAQGIIPNVCNLPNPCDDAAGESTTPPEADNEKSSGTDNSPPVATTAPAAPPAGDQAPSAAATTTTTTTPSATSASATPATETASTPEDDDEPDDDSPAVATAPGQFAPAGTGTTKLPQLLHAAGATRSSRDVTALGTLMIALLLASVATI